ncbi:MAG TPA: alpha/beta fold hydrolase, partial [Ilumatobacteraceae bacterium]|nr:alpha/beta fold hydrolase [Ilumatobacteraceae bacterium]
GPAWEHVVAGARAPLFVRELGAGQPVVVVHGGPDFDHEYLLPELDQLASSCRLLHYDQRGRGRSFDGAPPARVSMADEVADLERVRLTSGLDAIAILGHSWGGLVALEYTLAHPDRVTHLVLLNTAPASCTDATALRHELARRRTADQTRRMTELRSSPAFAAGDIATDAAYYRIHYGSTIGDAALLDDLIGRLRRSSTPRGVQVARHIEDQLIAETWSRPDYDLVPQLAGVRVPTLAIHGDNDLVPLGAVQRIVDAIPGAELLVLRACGHFSYLEHPHDVVAAVTALLRRPTGRRTPSNDVRAPFANG